MTGRSCKPRVAWAGCPPLLRRTVTDRLPPALGFGRCLLLAAAGAALLGAAGCGSDGGPTRYDLSGKVTYNGQPVPAGYILFAPDTSQGNKGPGAQADIQDGRYQTPAGQGAIGGPHVVTISGFDGVAFEDGPVKNPMGKRLFASYQTKTDLPKEAGTQDFTVPLGGKK